MSEHLEIEQKFDVDEDFVRPDFGNLLADVTAAEPVRYHLAATYFDTADTRLAAGKITLRRRTGGTDEGWHLKLPVGQDSRRELGAPLSAGGQPGSGEDAGTRVPEQLAAQVADVTGGRPLEPIARLDTERTVVTLTGPDGQVAAEIADDLVTARRLAGPPGTQGEPLRWREIEVEVREVAPELQRAAADLLRAAGARPGGHSSKLARLLGE